jgi:hypothetical protein
MFEAWIGTTPSASRKKTGFAERNQGRFAIELLDSDHFHIEMTEPDDQEEFYALAIKVIAERSTPEETLKLKDMLRSRPDLAEEVDRLRNDVPVVKEALMLLNVVEATEGEIPKYALERLHTKVRRTYSGPKRWSRVGKRLCWFGLGAGVLTALAVFVGYRVQSDRTPIASFATFRYADRSDEEFKTGRITQTFMERAAHAASTHGDVLEVAISQTDESFTRADSLGIAGAASYLGTTISEIRTPVTFRYHIRLSDRWQLSSRGNVCVVIAPSLRPSLPPAIHTDRMDTNTKSGWLRFNAQDNLRALEKSISPILSERAADAAHISLVRDTARKSVAEFVKNWLLREDHWRKDRFTAIIVVFEDEVVGGDSIEKARDPTLKM